MRSKVSTKDNGNLEWRKEYEDWHYELFKGKLPAPDVDAIEWGIDNDTNEFKPSAIIEVTCTPDKVDNIGKYLAAILTRYNDQIETRGRFTKYLSKKLEVPAYIIAFNKACKSFWVCYFTDENQKWYNKDSEQMKDFYIGLRVSLNQH
jgi:hypothetical protein